MIVVVQRRSNDGRIVMGSGDHEGEHGHLGMVFWLNWDATGSASWGGKAEFIRNRPMRDWRDSA